MEYWHVCQRISNKFTRYKNPRLYEYLQLKENKPYTRMLQASSILYMYAFYTDRYKVEVHFAYQMGYVIIMLPEEISEAFFAVFCVCPCVRSSVRHASFPEHNF